MWEHYHKTLYWYALQDTGYHTFNMMYLTIYYNPISAIHFGLDRHECDSA